MHPQLLAVQLSVAYLRQVSYHVLLIQVFKTFEVFLFEFIRELQLKKTQRSL